MRKQTLLLGSSFIVATSLGITWLGIVFFMRDFHHASPGAVGWLAATWYISYICGCILLGPLAQRLRSLVCVVLATSGMVLSMLAVYFVRPLPLVFVFYAAFGLATSLFWPPVMGWLASGLEGTALNRAISRFNLSWSTGTVISPFVAGLLSQINPVLPLRGALVGLGCACLLVLGSAAVSPEVRRDRHRERDVGKNATGPDSSTPLRYLGWVGVFTSYTIVGALLNIFPIFAADVLSISKSVIGLVFLVRALSHTVGFALLGRSKFWHFRPSIMVAMQGALATLIVLLALAGSPFWIAAVMVPLGLCMSVVYANSVFHGVSGSHRKSRRMAVHEATLSAGMVLGSGAGGMLYQHLSMNAVLGFCVAVVATGAVIQLLLLRRVRLAGSL